MHIGFPLKKDKSPVGNKLILGKPDPFILYLGLLIFCAAICRRRYVRLGVVFISKEIVKEDVFTYGYFIILWFAWRLQGFFLDRVLDKIGMPVYVCFQWHINFNWEYY